MKDYLSAHLAISLHALIIALVFVSASWYVHSTMNQIKASLHDRVVASYERLMSLALLTDRNGADELTERIIADCPRRESFEGLLTTLGTASSRDLITAQQLFESCGSFYAERKAFMVAQLRQEFERLQDTYTLLEIVKDTSPHDEARIQSWEELISYEEERSALLTEQTDLQASIISLLIEGNKSSLVEDRAEQAGGVNQSLMVLDSQIDTLRAKLDS